MGWGFRVGERVLFIMNILFIVFVVALVFDVFIKVCFIRLVRYLFIKDYFVVKSKSLFGEILNFVLKVKGDDVWIYVYIGFRFFWVVGVIEDWRFIFWIGYFSCFVEDGFKDKLRVGRLVLIGMGLFEGRMLKFEL